MRGQATAEALAALCLGLALLALALHSANSMKAMQENSAYGAMLLQTTQRLVDAADEVCVLGEGNYRQVPLPRMRIALRADGNELSAFYRNFSYSEKSICNLEVRGGNFSSKAHVWYSDEVPDAGEKPKIIISNETIGG